MMNFKGIMLKIKKAKSQKSQFQKDIFGISFIWHLEKTLFIIVAKLVAHLGLAVVGGFATEFWGIEASVFWL